ncbi:uncharacterized protein involved in type VI secretion and phage assembly [Pseudomonas sp. Tn43]|nr:uncharacterized protein involved in type VI secretion and phage assembly [Pseudomonas sp. Tn43]
MALSDHPRDEWNDLCLLLEIVHEGKQPQVLGENITSDVTDNKDDFHQGYRNRFLATPWDAHCRPALEHPKPKVSVRQCYLGSYVDFERVPDYADTFSG